MVVKKHVSILRNLIDWSTSVIGEKDDAGRFVVTDVPLLVIDDECDYASVNTREVLKDENGIVLEDCDPAMTNTRAALLSMISIDISMNIIFLRTRKPTSPVRKSIPANKICVCIDTVIILLLSQFLFIL
jgi:hypothetical protein